MSQFHRANENGSMKGVTTASQRSKSKTRFENVTPKTNSGYHVGKMMEDFDIIQRNFRFKPDEIFPRIKISLLVSLICESVYLESDTNKECKLTSKEHSETAHSSHSLHDKLYNDIKSEEPPTAILKPYLLLDVRDYDQYSKSHIITAENYPKVHLARANYESASLLKYRNHAEYVIVLYDEDEIIAPQVATTLMERGYNNVYMLSGGLKVAKHCFPHSLLVSQGITMSVEISKILAAQLQQMSFRYRK